MTLEDCDHNTSDNTGGDLDHVTAAAVVVAVVVVAAGVVGRINVVAIIFLSKMSILFVSILADVAHAGISSQT